MRLEHIVEESAPSSTRLDLYISDQLGLVSRSRLKARFLTARVNGKTVKLSCKVGPGDSIFAEWEDERESLLEAEDLPLDIIEENERFLVVNKSQGMVVHPAAGNPDGTLVNALLWYVKQRDSEDRLSTTSGRPGIVHRLDKDTSGLIICALDDEALTLLSNEFKARRVKKRYLAITKGCPKTLTGRIETLLARDPRDRKRFAVCTSGGKEARSNWRVLANWGTYSLLLLGLETGRTHQLRVHLRHIGCPILGDPIYGIKDSRFGMASLMLHARRLGIRVPLTDSKNLVWRRFVAPIPSRMKSLVRALDRHPGRQPLPPPASD